MTWTLLVVLVLGLSLFATLTRRAELKGMERTLLRRERAVRQGADAAKLQHPVIDLTRCLGCGTCVAACPEDGVLELVHGQAVVVNGARCVGVANCERECPTGAIQVTLPNTLTFFKYEDRNNVDSEVFAFSDRQGKGNNPLAGHPSMSHNVMLQHSIRGRATAQNEGNRYCVSCHLTDDGMAAFGAEYATLRTAMSTGDYTNLDFDLLKVHIGQNPGNQLDSPLWVHMVAGLGSGLFLFDENGCPVNPLDDNEDRAGCDDVAPADSFDLARVHFNLDRIVDENGVEAGSNNHPTTTLGAAAAARDGGGNPNMAGPLGMTLVRRLTDPVTGIVLDSWLDANGDPQGDAQDKLDGN
jgi:ferredoxin